MEKVTRIPHLVSFGDKPHTFKVGRGEAGWTVRDCGDARSAALFFECHQFAAMPCWVRFEVIGGELFDRGA